MPSCRFNASSTPPVAQISGYTKLPTNKYAPLMEAVATKGPIAVTVDASAWSSYESGVFDGCNQASPDLDHAVQLVGYGVDDTYGPYYLVRNSWGDWGEEGCTFAPIFFWPLAFYFDCLSLHLLFLLLTFCLQTFASPAPWTRSAERTPSLLTALDARVALTVSSFAARAVSGTTPATPL